METLLTSRLCKVWIAPTVAATMLAEETVEHVPLKKHLMEIVAAGWDVVSPHLVPSLLSLYLHHLTYFGGHDAFSNFLSRHFILNPKALCHVPVESFSKLISLFPSQKERDDFQRSVERVAPSLNLAAVDCCKQLLQSFPTSQHIGMVVAKALTKETFDGRDALTVLGALSYVADVKDLTLHAKVIDAVLRLPSLQVDEVVLAVHALAQLKCHNAVGALLLQHHVLLPELPLTGWRTVSDAVLKANLRNPHTRRALLFRGSQLISEMLLNEIEVHIRCEVMWADVAVAQWQCSTTLAMRVFEVAPASSVADLIRALGTFLEAKKSGSMVNTICSSLTNRCRDLEASDCVRLMRLLVKHEVRHLQLVQRIMTLDLTRGDLTLAVELFRFCGAFQERVDDMLFAAAQTILRNISMVSVDECIMLLNAMQRTGYIFQSLSKLLLENVRDSVHSLGSLQISIVAQSWRFGDCHVDGLETALVTRSLSLLDNIQIDC